MTQANKIFGFLIYLSVLVGFSLIMWVLWKFLLLPTFTSEGESIVVNLLFIILWVIGAVGLSIAAMPESMRKN